MSQFDRFELLIGKDNLEKLAQKKVLVFGIGGVGGHCVESLARSGITKFTLVDKDVVEETNINRQLVASYQTLNKPKVEIMKERILSVNPKAEVETRQMFYLPENENEFDFSRYDYVIDCVDTVAAKLSIIKKSKKLNVPVISALGAGNKMNPTELEVSDIYKTSVDPLAKVLRHELKRLGIKSLKVVYSKETPIDVNGRIPGSNAFVPSTMGIIIASEVIKDLLK